MDDDFGDYSPETRMILHALPDTPESLELKREYLQKKNRLNRGHIVLFSEALCLEPIVKVFVTSYWAITRDTKCINQHVISLFLVVQRVP